MLKVYPQLERARIDYAWGGTLAITMDRLPHIGKLSNHTYFAQGYSGHGVPTGIYTGQLIADAICGDAQAFEQFADLQIRSFPGGTWFRKPALFAGMSYYSLLDKL
jgi:gamma-glutamylputrescine oxidase